MFAISDKVVCVDDTPNPRHPNHMFPNGYVAKDTVYCVECIEQGRFRVGLVIVGKPVIDDMGHLTMWDATRFRKLEEIKAENALRAAIDLGIPTP